MKRTLPVLLSLAITSTILAAPFTPVRPDEPFGVLSNTWRFASNLSQDATGTIEVCYAEAGATERVLGRVELRPFRSSDAKSPDLRILFTKAEVDGKQMVVLLVGYGIRSGVFIVEVRGLTTHSLAGVGAPLAGPTGEYNLLGFGDQGVRITRDGGMSGEQGRLFFRYVEKT